MLIFEKGKEGRGLSLLPERDVEVVLPEEKDITQNWRRSVMESMTGSIHLVPVR